MTLLSLCIRPSPVCLRLRGVIQLQGCTYATYTVTGTSSKSQYPAPKRELLRQCYTPNLQKSFSVYISTIKNVQRKHVDLKHFSKSLYTVQMNEMFNLPPETSSTSTVCFKTESASSCHLKNLRYKSHLSQHIRKMSTDSNTFTPKKGQDETDNDVDKHEDVKKWIKELSNDFGIPNETVDQDITPSSDSESDSDDDKIIIVPKPVRPGEEPMNPDEIDKQMQRYDYEEFDENQEEEEEVEENVKQHPCSFERGSTGVFEIEELIAILEGDSALDVCVIRVPPGKKYVDYMVFATGKSTRHLKAMSFYIQWLYKNKRGKKDPSTVKIEGHNTRDWMAMDLGNIAVHLFLRATREKYDLETLWAVGPEFDDKVKEEDGISLPNDDFDWASLIMENPSKSSHTNEQNR